MSKDSSFDIIPKLSVLLGTNEPALRLLLTILAGKTFRKNQSYITSNLINKQKFKKATYFK